MAPTAPPSRQGESRAPTVRIGLHCSAEETVFIQEWRASCELVERKEHVIND